MKTSEHKGMERHLVVSNAETILSILLAAKDLNIFNDREKQIIEGLIKTRYDFKKQQAIKPSDANTMKEYNIRLS